MSMFNIHFCKELHNLYIANFTRFLSWYLITLYYYHYYCHHYFNQYMQIYMYVHTRERDSRPGFDGVKIKLLL